MSETNYPYIIEGIVKATDDPQQNGRLKIWCPSVDGEDFDVSLLPWADYATPFGGITVDYKTGRNRTPTTGPKSYGFWALPKIGAQVLVFFLNGDPNRRFYFASYFGLHRNRSIPAGRNKNKNGDVGPFSDSFHELQPAFDNLRTAFQDDVESSQAKTRGAFERQVAQDRTEKDGTDGYAASPVDQSYLDPQTYCLTTPGGHVFLLDDAIDNCRIRLKTTEGNQIIIDDTNERIYISTAKGKTWAELDEDGHIHFFAAESYSVRAGKDINLYADQDINMEAGRNINAKAITGEIKATAKLDIHIGSTTGSILQTACNEFHICSTNGYFLSALEINNLSETSILHTAAGGSYHIKAANEINLTSMNNSINLKAEGEINIKSNQGAGISFSADSNMIADAIKIKANYMELDGGRVLKIGATTMHTYSSGSAGGSYKPNVGFSTAEEIVVSQASNSADADGATLAEDPSIVPGHEPWKRPESAKERNKFWRE